MPTVRVVTALLTIVMAGTIIYGIATGSFGEEGGEILDLAWGRVTLIDLYVGLALFGGWIVVRERSAVALPWLIALVVLGNFASALYAFIAAMRSDSIDSFLTGRPATLRIRTQLVMRVSEANVVHTAASSSEWSWHLANSIPKRHRRPVRLGTASIHRGSSPTPERGTRHVGSSQRRSLPPDAGRHERR